MMDRYVRRNGFPVRARIGKRPDWKKKKNEFAQRRCEVNHVPRFISTTFFPKTFILS